MRAHAGGGLIPSRGELVYVGVGVIIGIILTSILFGTVGRDPGRDILMTLVIIGCFGLPVIFLAGLLREAKRDSDRSSQRLRDIEAEGFWLKTANRAASNKSRGLGWTGRHPRRR
jgi:hypothetical protein